MSLKAVELQVALPRTKDAGMQQNQIVQKASADQDALAQQSMQKAELERKAVTPSDSRHLLLNDKEDGDTNPHHRSKSKKKQSETTEESVNHPYKGRHIDYSL